MAPVVVVKLGGGLITDKARITTPRPERIKRLAEEIANAIEGGCKVVLVHGAGSYGHLRAKAWALAQGRSSVQGRDGCTTQDEAVNKVRDEMQDLASMVLEALEEAGVPASGHPPHQWATGIGPHFHGTLDAFQREGPLPVTWGDVVDVEGPAEFGILSGDDLVLRCALEVPGVKRVVFAMGGADGLLRRPPGMATAEDLIETWTEGSTFEGHHAVDMDVTGGIGLKVDRALRIANAGVEVLFVNGEIQGRLQAAMLGQSVRGTRFPPAQKG